MADFLPAYEEMILDEGGYQLRLETADRGGSTYAGIAREKNPQWNGWAYLDRGETPPSQMVRDFYHAGWWTPIQGDAIADQRVASSIFNFGVNAGLKVSIKLAQLTVGATPDGDFGPKTVDAVNACSPELFIARFALAKVARYAEICMRDRSQGRFLLGWVRRALGGV